MGELRELGKVLTVEWTVVSEWVRTFTEVKVRATFQEAQFEVKPASDK